MNVPVNELIAQFQTMYREHWDYKWGKSEYGCVDCSGAFSYVFKQYGITCPHGSNSIARTFIVGDLMSPINAQPGMVAFKVRDWRDEDKDNKWYGKAPGNLYHVGLVDDDARYVLNAKGEKYGFSRDKIGGWDYVAYLKHVDYDEGVISMSKEAIVVLPVGASGSTVRMRKSASKSADTLANVPVGSTVLVMEDIGTWCRIEYQGRTGYMMSNYLEYTDQEGESDTLTPDQHQAIDSALTQIEKAIEVISSIVGRG